LVKKLWRKISKKVVGMFEKSPAMSCRANARHPLQEIPRFTLDDGPPACHFVRDGVSLGDPSLSLGMTKRRSRGDSLFYLSCRANARHPIRKPLTSSSNIFEHPQKVVDRSINCDKLHNNLRKKDFTLPLLR